MQIREVALCAGPVQGFDGVGGDQQCGPFSGRVCRFPGERATERGQCVSVLRLIDGGVVCGALLVAVREEQHDVGLGLGEDPLGEHHQLDAAEPIEEELPDGGGVIDAEQLRRQHQPHPASWLQEQC